MRKLKPHECRCEGQKCQDKQTCARYQDKDLDAPLARVLCRVPDKAFYIKVETK